MIETRGGAEQNPAVGPLLSLEDVVIDAPGSVRLIDGFSLDIHPGERVALVGESGSGKSVMARTIMRLTSGLSTAGRVCFEGQDLLSLSEHEMRSVRGRRIGMVFQDPMGSLNPLMTIGDQVAEPLRIVGVPKKQARARACAVLEELGVANARDRMSAYPHEFSGGMRQRVVMAMALVGEPAFLIADEPTTALDVRIQEQVLDLLDRVSRERGLAVLLITHDLALVAGFSDRVVVMYAGKKVNDGLVERLFASPAHPYTAGLLDAVPRMDRRVDRLTAIPGAPPHPTDRPSGCPFHPRCAYKVAICSTMMPPLRSLPEGGSVACHVWAGGPYASEDSRAAENAALDRLGKVRRGFPDGLQVEQGRSE